VVDLGAAAARSFPLCAVGDGAYGLAMEGGPHRATIYTGNWHGSAGGASAPGAAGPGRSRPGSGSIVALHAATGAIRSRTAVAGAPQHLLLAPGPGGLGRRLYGVEWWPGPDAVQPAEEVWRLFGLDPTTLNVESAAALAGQPASLAIALDGDTAYVLVGAGGPLSGSVVLKVDLAGGGARPLAAVPGPGRGGLAVHGERLYVPQPNSAVVWAIDRRRGTRLEAIPVARAPIAITAPRRRQIRERARDRPAAWSRHRAIRPR